MEKTELPAKITFKSVFDIIKLTIQGFTDDKVTKLSASLAYATIFAMIPFLTLIVSIGAIFHQDIASEMYSRMTPLLGSDVVVQLQSILNNASAADTSSLATIISLGVTIFGATAIFAEIQTSLNTIWGIKPKPKKGWLLYLKNRLLSFSMILVLGFLMLVTLFFSTLITGLSDRLSAFFPDVTALLFQGVGMLVNIIVISVLFVLMFKVLPDAKIKLRDVAVGSVVTTVLFLVGQYAISFYMGTRNVTSVYGAAAFIIILLTWIYYSSIIIYIGAEFTKAWANNQGGKIFPDDYAVATKTVEIEQENVSVSTIHKEKVNLTDETHSNESLQRT
ncbi:YihY/virulence factor BrkB family protein [Limibacterium fermenti]|uniref:YihY/virulence factor BrkB family protein n=1 Tax=Limibacterium fermenti TaxID=3229863 RepID=UPI000E8078AB|nr:YihY/virulence factor BrkB family protein [Porphyromonadaceae bacterium]HBK30507.1 YihY/virulence factor BrkB family protein [Porphyromonadaceae bacterium]HBX19106.1 YihY/virulence factor BrkB family protein [Porphyromonadaceae bacterium]HBX45918.1 YihY/virulence factor BrkB family protein [Porphyromonadaceae bacterium]HCM22453.1 YihY/virulence factor BrkB family protein [Porphyromonadaceae bacterium]